MCKTPIHTFSTCARSPNIVFVEHYISVCSAVSAPRSWAEKFGWAMRRIADKLDGKYSYTKHVILAPGLNWEDALDAMRYGAQAEQKYLDDLWFERPMAAAPVPARQEK